MTEPKTSSDVNMTFYNEKEQHYLEADALGVSLGANLPHVRDGM